MPLQQQNIGDQSNAVQISGDGNTVTIGAGAPSLALARPQSRRADPKTELELLRVDIRATTLVGRAVELAALDAWLAGDGPIVVRCLTARAGTGKTRLAVELCERAERAGWTAGFVQNGPFQAFVKTAADWRWRKSALVVVDYAASFARDLRTWLEILASGHYPDAPKLRVLLLERHADVELGWFADLLRVTTFSAPCLADLADPPEPVPLASLGKLEDRRGLLAETMRRAAAIAGRTDAPEPPAPGTDAAFDRRLADDAIDNEPLYLMMAGAEAVRSGAPAALRLTRTDLAARAAAREGGRLERLAAQWGLPPALLTHLALCVTLQGGCDPQTVETILREEVEALSLPASPLAPLQTINRLAEAMPTSATFEIDAIRPDLVGEAFVLAAMRHYRSFRDKENAIIARGWKRAPSKVATTLVRVAQDFARGDVAHVSVRWLGDLIGSMRDLDDLIAFLAAMPAETLALREIAMKANQLAVVLLRTTDHRPEARPYLAFALTSMAVRLSDVGQREAALEAAREGVDVYRELATQQPNAFRPDLARSLNNLAAMLSDVGQREAALVAAREAVDKQRELVAQRPDAFRADLAGSLNNLATALSAVGQREAALDAAREGVEIRRELAAQQPGAFRPDLAGSLNNLAAMLGDVGQREGALAAAREAAEIRRDLATQRPDAFLPDLALSLNNLAVRLSEVGQRAAALDATREGADVYRELVVRRPEVFRPYLAGSLNDLANRLSDVGQREAALDAIREAVDMRRELAARRPDAFRPDLAMSLNNLANSLSAVGQREAALDAAREAVDMRRELAAQRPDAFRPDLAISLSNLSGKLSDVGQREAALDAAREAVEIRRELAAPRPGAFRPYLAGSLNDLAAALREAGQREAALGAAHEATDLYRELTAQRPDAFRHDLAMSLSNLAVMLSEVGQHGAALDAVREAVDLRREQAEQQPDAFRPDLASSLNNLANRLGEVGQHGAALDAAREAVEIRRELAAQRPEAFRPGLAMSLSNLAGRLSEVGQREAALDAAREAADLYGELARQRPDAFLPDLARSLAVLSSCLYVSERFEEALAADMGAIGAIAPSLIAHPRAFANLTMTLARQYVAHCHQLGREPDDSLLEPIAKVLQTLQGDPS